MSPATPAAGRAESVGTTSYVAPTSIEGVTEALAARSSVIAGGTDLVVGSRQGQAALPANLVAIHRVEELRGISATAAGGLRIGALVDHEQLATDPDIRERFTALADGAAIVGSPATRMTGTVGGNVMNASPAADTVGPLLCFDGSVLLADRSGTRSVDLGELFTGPGRTSAGADELLIAIDLVPPGSGTGSCYARLEYRRQMEIAVVGATAVVTIENGSISAARVAITALAPTIRRVPEAEDLLMGSDGSRAIAEAAAAAASAAATPIDDIRATAKYRQAMAAVICRRVIVAAIARANGEAVAIPASDSLMGAV
jgi:CO/xanthine dehydrogenase FAD-binding subunit